MKFENFNQDEFIQKHWNRQPLLVRGAVPTASSLVESSELIELATDDSFESRMIIESGGDYPWQLKQGPFKTDEILKNRKQTLICHKLNLLHKNFFLLSQCINFLPMWFFDDVMATYSQDGASCGAHVDNYSVFIIQGQGQRKWLLQPQADPTYRENLDVRILENFSPTEEYILDPGDMLYIPPHVAHHGISVGESISYSIGFKSVDQIGLTDYLASYLMQSDLECFFSGILPQKGNGSYELSKEQLKSIQDHLITNIIQTPQFEDALCSYLSRANGVVEVQEETEDLILQAFASNQTFFKDQNTFFLRFQDRLYCNSVPFELTQENYQKILPIIEGDLDAAFSKNDFQPDEQLKNVLLQWLKNGDLYFDSQQH